jgi:hypothetical protein
MADAKARGFMLVTQGGAPEIAQGLGGRRRSRGWRQWNATRVAFGHP